MAYKDALHKGTKIENNTETYEINGVISRGGFSFVYDAEMIIYSSQNNFVRTELFRTNVIIKELYIDGRSNRTTGDTLIWNDEDEDDSLSKKIRFKTKSEALKLSNLSSPHILKIKTAFEKNNTVYIVTDKIEHARDFGSILGLSDEYNTQKLSVADSIRYIKQICEALREVHNKNILHLDIKPDNILRDGNDNAVLIDFGISVSIDQQRKTTLLGARTPHYSPPEQGTKLSLQSISFATDIYALGCTLYVFLTGHLVPDFGEIVSGASLILAPSVYNPEISSFLDDVIIKAISIDRRDRFQTVEEFLMALDGEKEYYNLIEEAKNYFENKDFIKATIALNATLKFTPFSEDLRDLNQKIQSVFEQQTTENLLKKREQEALLLFDNGDLEAALERYNQLPETEEIVNKKKEISIAIRDKRIDSLKAEADKNIADGALKEALETYIELKKIMPVGKPEIDQKITELQDLLLKDEQYVKFVKTGETAFDKKDFKQALIQYSFARELKPDERFIKERIKLCIDKIKEEELQEQEVIAEQRMEPEWDRELNEKKESLLHGFAGLDANHREAFIKEVEGFLKLHPFSDLQEALNRLKAQKELQDGKALFERGAYPESEKHFTTAAQLVAAASPIRKEAEEFLTLIKKEKHYDSKINQARQLIEAGELDTAIQVLANIPKDAKCYPTSQQLTEEISQKIIVRDFENENRKILDQGQSLFDEEAYQQAILRANAVKPKSKYHAEARKLLAQCAEELKNKNNLQEGKQAIQNGQIEAGKQLLRAVPPGSRYANEAKLLLKKQGLHPLKGKKGILAGISGFLILLLLGIAGANWFITKPTPSNNTKDTRAISHAQGVNTKIDTIGKAGDKPGNIEKVDPTSGKETDQKDQAAWQIAQKSNTQTGYQQYLTSYPNGKYVLNAKEQIARLEKAPIKEEPKTKVIDAKAQSLVATKKIMINGQEFNGETLNGVPSGNGVMTFKSATLISKEDPNGNTAEPGDYLKGHWQNGKLEFGTLYDNTGRKKATIIIGRY